MSYDSWKTTDTTADTLPAPAEETCDCGAPLEGGRDGLCSDCVREREEHPAPKGEWT